MVVVEEYKIMLVLLVLMKLFNMLRMRGLMRKMKLVVDFGSVRVSFSLFLGASFCARALIAGLVVVVLMFYVLMKNINLDCVCDWVLKNKFVVYVVSVVLMMIFLLNLFVVKSFSGAVVRFNNAVMENKFLIFVGDVFRCLEV